MKFHYLSLPLMCLPLIMSSNCIANTENKLPKVATKNQQQNPFWWQKQSIQQSPKINRMMQSSNIATVKQEPVGHFVKLALDNHWQQAVGQMGVASGNYYFNDGQQQTTLAILRMNASVNLDAFITIWKQRAGMKQNDSVKKTNFTNQHGQPFQLLEFSGQHQNMLIAANKNQKYTFFKLANPTKISPQAKQSFLALLKKSVLIN